MLPTYVLARDHLEQAASILRGGDQQTEQLRTILKRTIALMQEYERRADRDTGVIDLAGYRSRGPDA